MLILLSPAKSLDYSHRPTDVATTEPHFMDQAAQLIDQLRAFSLEEVARLMDLSDKLAALNVARYAAWKRHPDPADIRAAALAFNGDVYEGLNASDWDVSLWKYAQQQLRILSGLYGLLRPQDALQPYRLEMGTALPNPRGKDLYAFWQPTLKSFLPAEVEAAGGICVNLASREYSLAAEPALNALTVVSPQFLEQRQGKAKIISFYAKKARGRMADWILRQQPKRVEDLQQFNGDGYQFSAMHSRPGQPAFVRPES